MTRPTRREFLAAALAAPGLSALAGAAEPAPVVPLPPKKVAGITTVYHHNSHADVILSRLLETQTLDGMGRKPALVLASLYIEQFPETDKGRKLAERHKVPLYKTIEEALTLGTGKLAVDGVLLVAEHGKYPSNAKGQTLYPRRRYFEETVKVFQSSGRVVPVFNDKHLAADWADSKWMYDTAVAMKIPFMAGSTLPLLWRKPAVDVARGAKLSELVAVSYHTLDHYGYHALEMVQCLAERRGDGETGVSAVQCVEGPAVWKEAEAGRFDRKMLDDALGRLEWRKVKGRIEDQVKNPIAFFLEYKDGFKAAILTLNYAVGEWACAWREQGKAEPASTLFWTQEARPFGHFALLVDGVEKMIHTGRPTWPVERTLLTSGALDALLDSKLAGGRRLATPHLEIAYKPTFDWKDPGPPPPGRPIPGQ
jgi:hypothetical protein